MNLSYHPRAPLADPGWFYGRTAVLGDLFSYLNKPVPQNVSIVGQRRIGKSWLLKKVLLDHALRSRHLDRAERYTFIYWDLQAEWKLNPERFLPRLIRKVVQELPAGLAEVSATADAEEDAVEAFLDILDLLDMEGHRVILLLDEFERVLTNQSFDEPFFAVLRALFNQSALSCVTASFRSLGEMSHLGPDSPFFNIFSRIQLGLFTGAEAEQFILEPFAAAGIEMHPNLVKEILKLAGPHPCFLSQLCHQLGNSPAVQERNALYKADVAEQQAAFYTSVVDDFTYYWRQLEEEEQMLLHQIASGEQPDAQNNPVLHQLLNRSLVHRQDDLYRPFSQLFGDFVAGGEVADLYLRQLFAYPAYDTAGFPHLCQAVLSAADHLPDSVRQELDHAIRDILTQPANAMAICGRRVLTPLLRVALQTETGQSYFDKQSDACRHFREAADAGRFPRHLASSFDNVRIAGNDASHAAEYLEPCTPARAFLTVLETIHVAAEVYGHYPVGK